ncbi:uncharacterized protein J7T54_000026 [Emericellopsis cladophorae]|uniref:Uncharacterized protein n=1 Tax=Emericellopsis cladophorae TaxID=2686198 RepID=A0A9P9XUM8_9HYPO|nr:uncharacterized protein J7T54_000026 [Emericellopsis cladophorae]KAI6777888.1 hypothetical protein J7T54_000026 [Emericellopsis cladophorae]
MPTPQYHGNNWSELQFFLVDLKGIFMASSDQFAEDSMRVLYASCCLKGSIKRRWTAYAQQQGGEYFTWPMVEQWLKDQRPDAATRCFDAHKRLASCLMHQQQKGQLFLDAWEVIEAEVPNPGPEENRVCQALLNVTQQYQDWVVGNGVPTTWEQLRDEALNMDNLEAPRQSRQSYNN